MHRRLFSWIRAAVGRGAFERQVDEEMRHHLEARADDLMRGGLGRDAALRRARIEFGGTEVYKEDCRESVGLRLLDELHGDLRYGWRTMARSPVFAAVAILSLSLGIGANTAIFHLLDVIRLRELPVSKPRELVRVHIRGAAGFGISNGPNADTTYPLWEQIRDRQQSFSSAFAWGTDGALLGDPSDGRFVNVLFAGGTMFTSLGLTPNRGRLLAAEDDVRGCNRPAAVVSDAFWRTELGAREDAVGRELTIDDAKVEIVGVAPASFTGLEVGRTFDVALPLCLRSALFDARNIFWLRVVGRLKPGWTPQQASAHLDALSPGIFGDTVPSGYSSSSIERYRSFRLEALPMANGVSVLRAEYGSSLWALLGMTAVVLLIACANLANLLTARATTRSRELAVRLALGASRGRLVRQLTTESAMLSFSGTALGVVLAGTFSRSIVSFLGSASDPVALDLSMDWRVFVFAATLGAATCFAFGLTAAMRSSPIRPGAALTADGRGLTGDRRRFSLQRALVAAQIAASVVLVVGALQLVQTFRNLTSLDPGFRTQGILVAFAAFGRMHLPAEARVPFTLRLVDSISTLPGVEAAATTTNAPLYGSSWTMGVRFDSSPQSPGASSKVTWVSADYFRAMDISLLAGRAIQASDNAAAAPVVVVTQTFARRFFGEASPIGHVMHTIEEPGYPPAAYEIVGVVRDTKYMNLREELWPIAFAPALQKPSPKENIAIVLRAGDTSAAGFAAIRRRIAEVDPRVLVEVRSFDADIRDSLRQERLLATLSGFFGQLAMIIAAIGLYGLVSYVVAARRHELAIRAALGASRTGILTLVLRNSLLLVGAGLAIGVPAALGVMRLASAMLFGVAPSDPPTIGTAVALLAAATTAASIVPAVRAARIDPIEALRDL